MSNNEMLANDFIEAIKKLAANPDTLNNFKWYLENHFDVWMQKYANDPESLTSEVKHFASIEF